MEKIRELLSKIGASKELADAIAEEFGNYKKTLREQSEQEFKTRLQKARDVCIEEVQTYKESLAKRLEVFLESMTSRIEKDIKKQVAIDESQAVAELKKIKQILEQDGDKAETEALQAAVTEGKKLKRKLAEVMEEKAQSGKEAERAKEIATKVLRQNRSLQEEINKSAGRNPAGTSLEEARTEEANPKTTRPTLVESQQRSVSEAKPQGDPGVLKIAETVDEV